MSCRGRELKNNEQQVTTIAIGDVCLLDFKSDNRFPMIVTPRYIAAWIDGKRSRNIGREEIIFLGAARELTDAVTAYLEEVIYIMDPANFIIEKRGPQARAAERKYSNKPKERQKPRKTALRPHYICLSETDTKSFLGRESTEPRPIHPVRGHWKKLISPRYVNKQGQILHIQQYYRGKGTIDGKNGWHYTVMVKENPTCIVPYQG
jgi:hypothetical protein